MDESGQMRRWLFLLGVEFPLLCAAIPARAGEPPREVSFATGDGGTVHADLYGQGERGVVLAHGAAFDKESWAPLATRLAGLGLRVLAIDFRGYGASKAGTKARGLDEDVLAAVRYLHARGADTVSVLGGSMGGGASALAATEARPGEIDRLILLSPVSIDRPEDFHARSILYIASRGERMAEGIRAQYERAPQPKHLALLDGDAHAQNIFKTDQGGALTELIVEALAGDRLPAHE